MAKTIQDEAGKQLLKIAREAIQRTLAGKPLAVLNPEQYPLELWEKGASFVTLTINGVLRGCVGSIQATDPLVKDVQERAVAAAFHDPRFPPLTMQELSRVQLEVSVLTAPERLDYNYPEQLAEKIRPGVDGLILKYHFRRATFLPQVWDQLPDPEIFLGRLCQKMGVDPQTWKNELMEAEVYQVVKFSEGD